MFARCRRGVAQSSKAQGENGDAWGIDASSTGEAGYVESESQGGLLAY